jgi:hypothetical protein
MRFRTRQAAQVPQRRLRGTVPISRVGARAVQHTREAHPDRVQAPRRHLHIAHQREQLLRVEQLQIEPRHLGDSGVQPGDLPELCPDRPVGGTHHVHAPTIRRGCDTDREWTRSREG